MAAVHNEVFSGYKLAPMWRWCPMIQRLSLSASSGVHVKGVTFVDYIYTWSKLVSPVWTAWGKGTKLVGQS
jgi:hypothetical protein